MDPAKIRELLSQHTDTLSEEIKAEDAFYLHTQCPMCGQSGCKKKLRAPKFVVDEAGSLEMTVSPFGMGALPEGHALCINCDTEFNPHTGMVFHTEASMIHGPE